MSARPVRVTQVVFDLNGGGMETLVANMAAHWHRSGVSMSVITLSGRVGRVGEFVRPLVEEFTVLRPTRGLSMVAPTRLVPAIRATRPDVVHLHTGAWYKGALAARLAGVRRVVYTEHGREHSDPVLARMQDHVASRWTHHVVAVSDRLRSYMIRAVKVRPERIVTIANGVDTTVFSPGAPSAALRRSLRIPDDALVIGSVGRFEPVKAYSRLVAAFADIRRRLPDRRCVLVLFGDGRDRPAIEAEVYRLGVRDDVRLPGWTDNAADGYRLLDVFAMTSLSEGMSLSLMEAMACGICPVVTDVGSNAEVLGSALAHHAVADGDRDAFVGAACNALASATQRREVGEQARGRAVAIYGLTGVLDRYVSLYRGGVVSSPAFDAPLAQVLPTAS
jgi:glycosyltransferase involved in cell wall biosynthesis